MKWPWRLIASCLLTVGVGLAVDLEPPANAVSKDSILLPIEVMGPPGFETSIAFPLNVPADSLPGGNQTLRILLKLHAYDYPGKGSLRLNNGDWIELNQSTLELHGLAAQFGGIGGGFRSYMAFVRVSSELLANEHNRLAFRFNATNGRSSGYRILGFNILTEDGTPLIDPGIFTEDDPSAWTAPLPDPADIEEGRRLWYEAELTVPPDAKPIRARCGDCHAKNGRDLKYFSFSNFSIRARSVFHGLSDKQGNQIASYIRSLDIPAPGRPWNPPYQPGPGLDSRPVETWAAGAGLNAVLGSDREMLEELAPEGKTTHWAPGANLNMRELPIPLQLPDWNEWLPSVHPIDGFPDFFTNADSGSNFYERIRNSLRVSDADSYRGVLDMIRLWGGNHSNYKAQKRAAIGNNWNEESRARFYSLMQWKAVKEWEIQQDFGLEGLNREVFGPAGEPRGWYSSALFAVSPNMIQTGPGPGIGNGTDVAFQYLSFVWYQLQLILNDGNKRHDGTTPIDWPYVYGFIKDIGRSSGVRLPSMQMAWLVRAMQVQENGLGPEHGQAGWNHSLNGVERLAHFDWRVIWAAWPETERSALKETYLRNWLDKVEGFKAEQFYAYWTKKDERAIPNPDGTFSDRIWYTIPVLQHERLSAELVNRMIRWASQMWPNNNWEALRNVSCSQDGLSVNCRYPQQRYR